ncbi:MAG: phosphonate metabolism protein/1,5-bisphosphokinase (PRPP-forming) PhnN [Rubellimicrobium sp.]|nr:phosphonate metabolism protein/1,5-bisphosphokinase (PRPP-forming) PhnN [Rubellimicrobium sp.]
MTGRLIAIVGPSGAGKDTLLAGALALRPEWHLVRRVITRPPDAGGEDHEAVDLPTFEARRARGDFALHWQAHGLCYGITHEALAPLRQGATVLFNGSRGALPQARSQWPGLEVVMVTAPVPILAARLATRGRESAEVIAARLERRPETPPADARLVINDGTPAQGVARLLAALDTTTAEP